MFSFGFRGNTVTNLIVIITTIKIAQTKELVYSFCFATELQVKIEFCAKFDTAGA